MIERLHRILLDYDGVTEEAMKREAERIRAAFPELGEYRIEPSNTSIVCWTLIFPKSVVPWAKAVEVLNTSNCDQEWKEYALKYGCMAKRTETSMDSKLNPPRKPRNPPVDKIRLPVEIVIYAKTPLDLKRLIKLCEVIDDKTWEWKAETPLYDLKTRVYIGCQNEGQAKRRVRMIKEIGIEATFIGVNW